MSKMGVTIPLTVRQKEQIRRATGRTISAVKVESAGRLVATRKLRTTKRVPGPMPIGT